MTTPSPLTPEQQLLMDQYQQATNAYWQLHDAYTQAADALGKSRRACLAAGFNPASYLDFDA